MNSVEAKTLKLSRQLHNRCRIRFFDELRLAAEDRRFHPGKTFSRVAKSAMLTFDRKERQRKDGINIANRMTHDFMLFLTDDVVRSVSVRQLNWIIVRRSTTDA